MILNPFFRVPGHFPEPDPYDPAHLDPSAAEILDPLQTPSLPPPDRAPEAFENTTKAQGVPLRWADVQNQIGANDFATFARTVWLWALQVRRADKDPAISNALDAVCTAQALFPPEEDQLQAIMEPMIGRYLSALGLQQVTLWDEWRQTSCQIDVSCLGAAHPCVALPNEKTCAIEGPGVLFSWAFDDTYGLLALTGAQHALADPLDHFEGFALTGSQYRDVFNPPEMFERKAPGAPN